MALAEPALSIKQTILNIANESWSKLLIQIRSSTHVNAANQATIDSFMDSIMVVAN